MTVNYYEYLQSPEWEKLTEPIRERNGGLCECCNMRYGSEVHHRTYDRLGQELPEDLIHVCNQCHKMIEGILPICFYYVWDSRKTILENLREEKQNYERQHATTRTSSS